MAQAPTGLGLFLWEFSHCEGGNLAAIINKCKRCGISWLAVHMDAHLTKDVIDKLHGSGLYVACWSYCVPGISETAAWIKSAVAFRDLGVDGILADLEIEWESRKDADGIVHPSDRRPEARVFAKQLRDALGPDIFLGNAGAWQWPDRHPVYPDHAFGSTFNAGLPERYWTMFSPTEPAVKAVDESEHEWAEAANSGAYQQIIPIGSAFDGSAQGGQALRVTDLVNFLNRQADCALWSWQHVPGDVWTALEQRATNLAVTAPNPPFTPADPPVTPDCANSPDDPENA